MQTRRDILIWLAIWSLIIMNISRQEICSVQEASRTALTELISQTDAATLTAAHLLYALTAAVNVWVATLSLVVKNYGKEKAKL